MKVDIVRETDPTLTEILHSWKNTSIALANLMLSRLIANVTPTSATDVASFCRLYKGKNFLTDDSVFAIFDMLVYIANIKSLRNGSIEAAILNCRAWYIEAYVSPESLFYFGLEHAV